MWAWQGVGAWANRGEREQEEGRKDLEVGVLKGWEVGEIEGNYTPLLNILQSKKS